MKKRTTRVQHASNAVSATDAARPAHPTAFTFGEATPILNRAELLDYAELVTINGWYEPPVSFAGLSKIFRSGTHHASAIYFKRNVLASTFIPHPLMSRESFRRWALDFMIFGNGYQCPVRNRLGGIMRYEPPPAKYMRRRTDLQTYVQTNGWQAVHEFEAGSVHHLIESDVNQEIYGLPEYLGSLHAAMLNESSTLFRRRYYENGSHAGFILYLTDDKAGQDDIDALRDALKSAKGPGNFRNLFYYAPGGNKDGIQLIPVSEVAAKDEFFNIKNITRDDLLAAHRVPPQLLGIVPSNTGGFGAADTAARVFGRNEIAPLQAQFMAFNEWAGDEIVRFEPYTVDAPAPPAV
ncbi:MULTISPECIES: phage portal protein [Burkholderia cepacia complex]|uniref:phage portal protein n=1 Tax=Burkholderia cepacia complex TaxID=87882 RepID=UPI000D00CF7E|nr:MULTISPECIES: phage portal protein [Burkholderia cepacia complex]MBU9523271.1 phage portal protein [Burkholderia multivorans]MCA8285526.1 phage portal protein [Burkholderia vietnamiensis]MCA8314470.1 phage portal protein [Burkholderia multivorans]MDN7446066.1 phage portal protein [Burkholderia multivorans]PRF49902.1 phage portal protein [Burkholderia multivorans]